MLSAFIRPCAWPSRHALSHSAGLPASVSALSLMWCLLRWSSRACRGSCVPSPVRWRGRGGRGAVRGVWLPPARRAGAAGEAAVPWGTGCVGGLPGRTGTTRSRLPPQGAADGAGQSLMQISRMELGPGVAVAEPDFPAEHRDLEVGCVGTAPVVLVVLAVAKRAGLSHRAASRAFLR